MKFDEDKFESYMCIYVVICILLSLVVLWAFLICYPPIMIVLNEQKWTIAFAICYPIAAIISPAIVFGIYCGYQYIKDEIIEMKEQEECLS